MSDLSEFWQKQKTIKLLDPNITACTGCEELFEQLIASRAYIDFTQGLDIRLLTDKGIEQINAMRLKNIHFAWDNPTKDLSADFCRYATMAKHKPHGNFGSVYVLTNYNSVIEQNLERVYKLREIGFDPYVMIYDKPNAPKEIRHLQRWVNNKRIFRTIERFEDYNPKKR